MDNGHKMKNARYKTLAMIFRLFSRWKQRSKLTTETCSYHFFVFGYSVMLQYQWLYSCSMFLCLTAWLTSTFDLAKVFRLLASFEKKLSSTLWLPKFLAGFGGFSRSRIFPVFFIHFSHQGNGLKPPTKQHVGGGFSTPHIWNTWHCVQVLKDTNWSREIMKSPSYLQVEGIAQLT